MITLVILVLFAIGSPAAIAVPATDAVMDMHCLDMNSIDMINDDDCCDQQQADGCAIDMDCAMSCGVSALSNVFLPSLLAADAALAPMPDFLIAQNTAMNWQISLVAPPPRN